MLTNRPLRDSSGLQPTLAGKFASITDVWAKVTIRHSATLSLLAKYEVPDKIDTDAGMTG